MGVNDYPLFLGKAELYQIISDVAALSAQMSNGQNLVLNSVGNIASNINAVTNSLITATNNLANIIHNGFSDVVDSLSNGAGGNITSITSVIETMLASMQEEIKSNKQALQTYIEATNELLKNGYDDAIDEVNTNIQEFQDVYKTMYEDNRNSMEQTFSFYNALVGIETSRSIELMYGTFDSVSELASKNMSNALEGVSRITNPIALTIDDLNDRLDKFSASLTDFNPADLKTMLSSMFEQYQSAFSDFMNKGVG